MPDLLWMYCIVGLVGVLLVMFGWTLVHLLLER